LEQKRKCIACGEIKPKSELIKITKEHTSGDIVVQPNSKTFGRSVYLCYNENCINTAFKKSKINKMLRTSTNIDKERLSGYTRPAGNKKS
jgi:hypothetical protein